MEENEIIEKAYSQFKKLGINTSKLIITWLKEGLKRNNNTIEFDNDNEEIMPVYLSVEVDRHTGDCNEELVEVIELSNTGNIYVSTQHGYKSVDELNAYELYDLYTRILDEEYVKNGGHITYRKVE